MEHVNTRIIRLSSLISIVIVSIIMFISCGDTFRELEAPEDVQAVAGDGEVTIRWSPVSGAISYNIYWNASGGVTSSDDAIINAASPYVHMNLTNGLTYYYGVTAINNEGESDLSTEVSAAPVQPEIPPSAPTGVEATAGNGQVTVSWSPVEGATTYNIYWNTSGGVTSSDDVIIDAASPYIHMNLTNGTTYYYAVTAINNEGESDLSTEVSAAPVQPETPPSAPTGVEATGENGQVTVSWSPVSGAISYNIYWNTTGSVTTSDDVIINAASPYVHMNLTNGFTYYYAVTAINNAGESDLSIEVSATPVQPEIPPSAPTGVEATAGNGQVTVSWSPVEGATTYNIYWNTSGGVTTSDDVIIDAASPYVHMNLTNGTTYYYAVIAINSVGESSLSTEVSAIPTLFSQIIKKLTATDAEPSDGFGQRVSISGDYAIVGTMSEDAGGESAGAAYIFHRTGPDTWDSGTKIMAPDAQANDLFGISVSISGDYAIVGASDEAGGDGDPLFWAGAAYIYHRTGPNAWDSCTKIVAPDTHTNDRFGYSVSINGDYAIVGAVFKDGFTGTTLYRSGAAYIFHRTDINTWDTGTKVLAFDQDPNDYFGNSVSISGDYAIVGAHDEDGGTGGPVTDAGAAYIFHRTDTNAWDAGTKVLAFDQGPDDNFGDSVSISGDYAIVGANREDGGTGDPLLQAGAAYIFRRTGINTWDAGTKIVASDAQAGDSFGGTVSISGDYAVVSAVAEDGGIGDPKLQAGAAYVFHRTALNSWDAVTKILAPDARTYDYFGWSVSISGGLLIVGATQADGGIDNQVSHAGAGYIFR